ncbi:MAG: hypothetical protein J3R72DRAFT_492507 [Linnemannia gamsii]|nr:MAG: hypothetical protein J3R72DRAFT_492507 [Linnemannia gamsii]
MKTISILLLIALFGVVAVSTTPVLQGFDDNVCEYFGSKRDDIKKGYKWPEGLMEAHDHAEFAKR